MKHCLQIFRIAAVFVIAGSGSSAWAVSLRPGDLLLADDPVAAESPKRILRFDPTTGMHDVVSSGGLFQRLNDITVDNHGSILAVDSEAGVVRVDPTTGAQTTVSGGFFDEGYGFPWRAIVLPTDDIIVTTTMGKLVRVDPANGSKTLLATLTGAAGGIAQHDGDLIVTTSMGLNSAVFRVDHTTGESSQISAGGLLFAPVDLALGVGGVAYVNDLGILVEVDLLTGAQRSAAAGGFLFEQSGVTIGANDLPILCTLLGYIIQVDPNNFGEQTFLTAPGERLGRLVAIHHVTAVPCPGGVACFLVPLALIRRRGRSRERARFVAPARVSRAAKQ